ncbi:hypothetical protein JTE90_006056 [Oedothorax gibbosus]|uniref:Ras-GEF domain-containing protein n=1 Tax=Oedothorax gibbosus TaxID=931172 RepID=A0AAV6V5U9_9ARAC|nr:hypothetical protein JTE90_006056 [Oedothorax gibbosus]
MKFVRKLFKKSKVSKKEDSIIESFPKDRGDGQAIVNKPVQIYGDLIDLEPSKIAKIIAQKDWETFKHIKQEDLPEYQRRWLYPQDLPNRSNDSEVLKKMAQNYTEVYYWTLEAIIQGQTPNERAKVLKKLLQVAQELLKANDLNATHAIVAALTVPAVELLDKTWKKVSTKNKKMRSNMEKLFRAKNNYARLSTYMQQQMREHKIVIPVMTLVVRDFKVVQPPCPDISTMTLKRTAVFRAVLKLLKEANHAETSICKETLHYWDSLHVTQAKVDDISFHLIK